MALNFTASDPFEVIDEVVSQNEGATIDDAKELAKQTKETFNVENADDRLIDDDYFEQKEAFNNRIRPQANVSDDVSIQEIYDGTGNDDNNNSMSNNDTTRETHIDDDTSTRETTQQSNQDILESVGNMFESFSQSSDYFDIRIKIVDLSTREKIASFDREMHKDDYEFEKLISALRVPKAYQLLISQADVTEKSYLGYQNDRIYIEIPCEKLENNSRNTQVFTRYLTPTLNGKPVGQMIEQHTDVNIINGNVKRSKYKRFDQLKQIKGLQPAVDYIDEYIITSKDDDQIKQQIPYEEVIEIQSKQATQQIVKIDKNNNIIDKFEKPYQKQFATNLLTGQTYSIKQQSDNVNVADMIDDNEKLISYKYYYSKLIVVVDTHSDSKDDTSQDHKNNESQEIQQEIDSSQINVDPYVSSQLLENLLETLPEFTQKSAYSQFDALSNMKLSQVQQEYAQRYLNFVNNIRSKTALRPLILDDINSAHSEYSHDQSVPRLYDISSEYLADRHLEKIASKVVDEELVFDDDVQLAYDLFFNSSISYVQINVKDVSIDQSSQVCKYRLQIKRK